MDSLSLVLEDLHALFICEASLFVLYFVKPNNSNFLLSVVLTQYLEFENSLIFLTILLIFFFSIFYLFCIWYI